MRFSGLPGGGRPGSMGPRTAQGRGRNQDQVAAADGQRVFHVPVKTQAAPCGLPFL